LAAENSVLPLISHEQGFGGLYSFARFMAAKKNVFKLGFVIQQEVKCHVFSLFNGVLEN